MRLEAAAWIPPVRLPSHWLWPSKRSFLVEYLVVQVMRILVCGGLFRHRRPCLWGWLILGSILHILRWLFPVAFEAVVVLFVGRGPGNSITQKSTSIKETLGEISWEIKVQQNSWNYEMSKSQIQNPVFWRIFEQWKKYLLPTNIIKFEKFTKFAKFMKFTQYVKFAKLKKIHEIRRNLVNFKKNIREIVRVNIFWRIFWWCFLTFAVSSALSSTSKCNWLWVVRSFRLRSLVQEISFSFCLLNCKRKSKLYHPMPNYKIINSYLFIIRLEFNIRLFDFLDVSSLLFHHSLQSIYQLNLKVGLCRHITWLFEVAEGGKQASKKEEREEAF